jgi:LacI family transcriptional regulator
MATMNDVARRAGVSVSTVSHVVNGSRVVNEPKRRLVLDAIDHLGYVHNAAARALRTSRSDSIGLVVSDAAEPAFAEMVRGVEHEARAAGFTLLLTNSAEDSGREADSIAVLVGRRVDGLIVARAAGAALEPLVALRDRGTPVVLLDRLADESWDQVGVESASATEAVVSHLIDLGHEHIALAAGDTRVSTLAERKSGYVAAFQRAGRRVDDALVVEGPGHPDDTRVAVGDLLGRRRNRPTAVFAASTPMAVGALQAVRDRGLSVPGDIAFAHFDGFPQADLFTPALTCIEQPAFETGRAAMRLLRRRIDQPDVPPETVHLEPTIVHRQSCGCPNPGTPIVSRSRSARGR